MKDAVRYIGVKVVHAKPMTLGAYNKYRSWVMPSNEDPEKAGYLVIYSDTYVFWCPKDNFEEANRPFDSMSFGHAIEVMKHGGKVARKGWNGKDMFLYYVPGDTYKTQTCIARESFGDEVECGAYICMKPANGPLVIGWLASQTDMLAEDWIIIG